MNAVASALPQSPLVPPGARPSPTLELQRAEQAMQNAQALRQALESQARAAEALGLELLHGYNYAKALDRDLREQTERLRQVTKQWREDHPLRNALSDVLGEPPLVRESREREERMRKEQEKAREQRGELKRQALENADKEAKVKQQLAQAVQLEREASQRVEQLLKALPGTERQALREQVRPQIRQPMQQEQ